MQKRVLAGVVLLAVLLALIFAFYPGNSQEINLSTGAGISKMLRYENAQVYLFGETHRCTKYQQFRNALFQYLVKEKGVRVLVEESGYATAFLENETVQGRLSFSDWLDRCTLSKEDYELYSWIADWNSGRDAAEKISIIGIDITDDVGNIQTLCQYLLKKPCFTSADTQTQGASNCDWEQNRSVLCNSRPFQEKFLPQLAELYQTKPKQLETVLGTQTVYLERALLGWEEAQEQQRLKGETEQLGGPDGSYRENCLYEHFMWEYQQRPDANIMGSLAGRTF